MLPYDAWSKYNRQVAEKKYYGEFATCLSRGDKKNE